MLSGKTKPQAKVGIGWDVLRVLIEPRNCKQQGCIIPWRNSCWADWGAGVGWGGSWPVLQFGHLFPIPYLCPALWLGWEAGKWPLPEAL